MANTAIEEHKKKLAQQLALCDLLANKSMLFSFDELVELGQALTSEEGLNSSQQKNFKNLEKLWDGKLKAKKAQQLDVETAKQLAKAVYQLSLEHYRLSADQQQALKVSWQSRVMISSLWAVPLSTLATGFFDGIGLNIVLLLVGFLAGLAYSFYTQKQTHDSFSKEYRFILLKHNILAKYNRELFIANIELLLSKLVDAQGNHLITDTDKKQFLTQLISDLEETKNYQKAYAELFAFCKHQYNSQKLSIPAELEALEKALQESLLKENEPKPEKDYGWRFWEYPWLTKKVWLETILIGSASSASTIFSGYMGFFAGVTGALAPYLLIGLGIAVSLALLGAAIYAEYREHINNKELGKITKQHDGVALIKKQQGKLQKTLQKYANTPTMVVSDREAQARQTGLAKRVEQIDKRSITAMLEMRRRELRKQKGKPIANGKALTNKKQASRKPKRAIRQTTTMTAKRKKRS